MPLQAYPVAGTQVYLSAVPLTFLFAVTFDEVVADSKSSLIAAALVLVAGLGLLYELGALRTLAGRYHELTPLALPGASSVRLRPAEVVEYQRLTQRMKQFDTFVSQPGLLSLHFWTERPPPTTWNAGAWMRLIVPERQREIVAALQRAERPGAAVNARRAAFWTEQRQDLSVRALGQLELAAERPGLRQRRDRQLGLELDAGAVLRSARTGRPLGLQPARGIDGRTDLYALACAAYWALTGQLVFHANTPAQMLLHHAQTRPEPPSTVSELPIPEELDRLMLQCLEKDPARRPASALELESQLTRVRDTNPWTPDDARQWWEVHAPEVVA